MAVTNYLVFTAAQRTTAMQGGPGWGDGEVATDPRAIDNASPGIGLNLNPDATAYAGGAVVPLSGGYVANKRMVDDPQYLRHAADLVAFLLTLPWCTLEPETIFAPIEE